MENKKKFIIVLIVTIVIILSIVLISILIMNHNNKQDDENNNTKEEENQIVISKDSIMNLAQNEDLKINTEFNNNVLVSSYQMDNSNLDIRLINDNGLYLVGSNNHKIKINNFKETVVTIIDAENNCSLDDTDILILTTEGNLYAIEHASGAYRFNQSFYLSFNDMTNYNLRLKKLNKNLKVLAITNITDDSRGNTCSLGRRVVYASDNNYYYYDTFEKIDNYIEKEIYPSVCQIEPDCGLLVYHDQTISIDNNNLIKDMQGNNILYKEHYIDKNGNIYLISQNDNLNIFNFRVIANNVLHNVTYKKLKNVTQENNKVIFILEDNTNITIELGE